MWQTIVRRKKPDREGSPAGQGFCALSIGCLEGEPQPVVGQTDDLLDSTGVEADAGGLVKGLGGLLYEK
jgi:hypothetical protein